MIMTTDEWEDGLTQQQQLSRKVGGANSLKGCNILKVLDLYANLLFYPLAVKIKKSRRSQKKRP